MREYGRILLQYRVQAAICILALFVASALTLPPKLDFSVVPLLEASEEARQAVRDYNTALPPRPVQLVCTLDWGREITFDDLDRLAAFSERIDEMPDVRSAVSLATTQIMEPRGDRAVPVDFRSLRDRGLSVREQVERHPLIRGRLLSHDGHSAGILLMTSRAGLGGEWDISTLERLERAVAEHKPEGTVARVFGGEVVERAMASYMTHDMLQSLILEALAFVILLPLLFRTWRGMLIPLFVINSGVLFAFGFNRLIGGSFSLIETAIPGLVVIIGLCDAIHMIHRFEEAYHESGDRHKAILDMMERVGTACLHTSFTTSLGFLSLLIAEHSAVRDFAVSASIGVLIAFASVITMIPLLLSWWPIRHHPHDRLENFPLFGYGRPLLTVSIFAAACLISAAGLTRIVVDSHWLEELPSRDPIVADLNWYETHFNGLLNIDVRLEGDLDTVEALRGVEALTERMIREEGVTGAESFATWVREMLGNPPADSVDERALARGIGMLKLTGDLFPRHLVTEDFKQGRLEFQTHDVGTKRYLELQDLLTREAASLPPSVRAEVGGYSRMAHESSRLVVTTMLDSMILSLVSICLFVMIIYRSIRLGLLASIPNTFPILFALGLTGWMGIQLRIGIVMIYCLGIGLAVDDSIHLITRFMQERKRHPERSTHENLMVALRTTGMALVITSVVLIVGALCYLPSSFKSMNDVGILLTAIVASALLADLYLLPHLLEYVYGKGGASESDGTTTPES